MRLVSGRRGGSSGAAWRMSRRAVICANLVPDHPTIGRFRQRHEAALAGLFGEVLALCAEAGLVGVGVVAVDGTKVHANASQHATRDYDQIAFEILAEAGRVDVEEDARFGERRRDELPPELATAQGRRGWLREAKHRLDEQRSAEGRPIPRSPQSGCGSRSAASSRSTLSSARRTPITRPTGRAG